MSILFGSAQQAVNAIQRGSLAAHAAKSRKYHLRAGDMYLHQSGHHLQDTADYAWCGTMPQAVNMRRDYPAAAGCKTRAVVVIPNIVFNTEDA